ncbi:Uncharacterised protein [Vibrio cholerae]|nr:Uncharacterised protein [Vibrio cholerae]
MELNSSCSSIGSCTTQICQGERVKSCIRC